MDLYLPRAPSALAGRRAPGVEVPVRPAQPPAHPAVVAVAVAVAAAAAAVAAAVAAALGRRGVQRPLRAPQGMRRGAATCSQNYHVITEATSQNNESFVRIILILTETANNVDPRLREVAPRSQREPAGGIHAI